MGAVIIASPWTPPAWMKSNDNIVGGILKDSLYASYAAHLKAFVDFMSNNGVTLYSVSIQNEPDVHVNYESCDWNASQMLKFVKNNAMSIGTKIIVPESYNFNHTISDAILNDLVAVWNISIIGGHLYGSRPKSYPLAESKGKEIWMTEHLDTDTTWSAVFGIAEEIDDCMYCGMNAYIWWYIRRFYGPINDDGEVSKLGYIISQYARFIRPGFDRIPSTNNPQASVFTTAYKKDSKIIIVAQNHKLFATEQIFTLINGTVSAFTHYVTSKIKNCVMEKDIYVTIGSFTAMLDAESVNTFVSE